MKSIKLTLLAILFSNFIFAQAPQSFNYQGAARDVSGNPIANQNIGLHIAILQGSADGNAVYQEEHMVSTTNLGLFSLQIGTGDLIEGSDEFSAIEWGNSSHFIQISLDENGDGVDYQLIGTTQLLSVPYALYAENGGGSKWKDTTEGIAYDMGSVSISNNNTEEIKRGLTVETAIASGFADYVVGITSNIESGFGYAVGMQTGAYSQTPSNQGRSYGIRAIAGNATPGANFGVFAQVQGENNGSAILAYNKVNYPSWNLLIPDNRSWAGFFYGGVHVKDQLGIGTTNPAAKLQITQGDVYIEDIGQGVIMKSPDGQCWRYTPDNNGQLVPSAVACPN